MASIKVIGSGSSGNGYLIECSDGTIIIELGLTISSYLESMGYESGLKKVCGALVSHRHGDHFKEGTAAYLHKCGIQVFSNQDVCDMWKCVKLLPIKNVTHIGPFDVQPIPLYHSVENYGFLIKHKEFGKLVFATDTRCFPYRMKEISHFMIEANWMPEYVIDDAAEGVDNRSLYNEHLSIDDALEAIKKSKSPMLETVILIHLSGSNANPDVFRNKSEYELCMNGSVFVAEKGIVIDLNRNDF